MQKTRRKKHCKLLLLFILYLGGLGVWGFGGSDSLLLIELFYTLIMLNCRETSPILLPTTCLIRENAKTMQMAPRKIRKLYTLKKSKTTTTITAAACKEYPFDWLILFYTAKNWFFCFYLYHFVWRWSRWIIIFCSISLLKHSTTD